MRGGERTRSQRPEGEADAPSPLWDPLRVSSSESPPGPGRHWGPSLPQGEAPSCRSPLPPSPFPGSPASRPTPGCSARLTLARTFS